MGFGVAFWQIMNNEIEDSYDEGGAMAE